jgi:hypothetical protein
MTPPPGFDIKDFRQPVVTSLGVIVGFLLGYLGQWVTETDFVLRNLSDHVHFWGIVAAAGLLLVALYRMLLPLLDPAQAYRYYRHTLRLYMGAVGLAIGVIGLSPFL